MSNCSKSVIVSELTTRDYNKKTEVKIYGLPDKLSNIYYFSENKNWFVLIYVSTKIPVCIRQIGATDRTLSPLQLLAHSIHKVFHFNSTI